jgi:hypothetical protein
MFQKNICKKIKKLKHINIPFGTVVVVVWSFEMQEEVISC